MLLMPYLHSLPRYSMKGGLSLVIPAQAKKHPLLLGVGEKVCGIFQYLSKDAAGDRQPLFHLAVGQKVIEGLYSPIQSDHPRSLLPRQVRGHVGLEAQTPYLLPYLFTR